MPLSQLPLSAEASLSRFLHSQQSPGLCLGGGAPSLPLTSLNLLSGPTRWASAASRFTGIKTDTGWAQSTGLGSPEQSSILPTALGVAPPLNIYTGQLGWELGVQVDLLGPLLPEPINPPGEHSHTSGG